MSSPSLENVAALIHSQLPNDTCQVRLNSHSSRYFLRVPRKFAVVADTEEVLMEKVKARLSVVGA